MAWNFSKIFSITFVGGWICLLSQTANCEPPAYGAPKGGYGLKKGYSPYGADLPYNHLDYADPYYESPNYDFRYEVYGGGPKFGHMESRKDYFTNGRYHVLLPDGRKQTVTYYADATGYHPTVTYEYVGNGLGSGGYGPPVPPVRQPAGYGPPLPVPAGVPGGYGAPAGSYPFGPSVGGYPFGPSPLPSPPQHLGPNQFGPGSPYGPPPPFGPNPFDPSAPFPPNPFNPQTPFNPPNPNMLDGQNPSSPPDREEVTSPVTPPAPTRPSRRPPRNIRRLLARFGRRIAQSQPQSQL